MGVSTLTLQRSSAHSFQGSLCGQQPSRTPCSIDSQALFGSVKKMMLQCSTSCLKRSRKLLRTRQHHSRHKLKESRTWPSRSSKRKRLQRLAKLLVTFGACLTADKCMLPSQSGCTSCSLVDHAFLSPRPADVWDICRDTPNLVCLHNNISFNPFCGYNPHRARAVICASCLLSLRNRT